jgi:hypothetical protein
MTHQSLTKRPINIVVERKIEREVLELVLNAFYMFVNCAKKPTAVGKI